MDFFTTQPPWYIPLALLLTALLVGLIKAYRLWQDMYEDDEPASDRERLSELEEAHFAGELDADELRRVRELLSRSNASKAPEPLRSRPSIQPEPSPLPPSNSAGEPDTV
ncbi:hypothetical protein [Singulisphaera acidiphila]|uniref:Uncharacterized protein n=1 Tax=Singulisphaera acidiphila (strain ATCC BAA-1392 / DSM 18658 / VKM B-2454 / MOB10) TaxID=886293 RepID=L0DGI1_SINAD|nr:hypothetical protein [Singulisphaera acidiphila]AGA27960.1 hypothetical protein Sinac_3721 [Singulisphaera acidiphila DSM 18658]